MLDRSALKGTNQIRSYAIETVGPFAAHFAFGGDGRGRKYLRRDGDVG